MPIQGFRKIDRQLKGIQDEHGSEEPDDARALDGDGHIEAALRCETGANVPESLISFAVSSFTCGEFAVR